MIHLKFTIRVFYGFMFIIIQQGVYGQSLYRIEKLPSVINSSYEEIKPFISMNGDSLFFIRSYSPENKGGEFAGEDIWLSVFVEGEGWSMANNVIGNLNHVGPDIFVGKTSDGQSLYTVNYLTGGQDRYIKIHAFDLYDGESPDAGPWEPFEEIRIGNDYHDLYLNPEATILLISMAGLNTLGQEDLYVSLKSQEGQWSPLINLGPVVNSRGFEISPFLSVDQRTLYFASDGHQGMGDADIFYCKRLDAGWENWSEPVNMGSPFNTSHFDAYLSFNQHGEYFLASNREGTYSDIFKVTQWDGPFMVENGDERTPEKFSDQHQEPQSSELKQVPIKLTVYFDFNNFKLEKEELIRLGNFVNDKMAISTSHFEINGYTDNVGSESYNRKLSEKRARFVYKYLRNVGIETESLSMAGKGIWKNSREMEIPPEKQRRVEIIEISHSE